MSTSRARRAPAPRARGVSGLIVSFLLVTAVLQAATTQDRPSRRDVLDRASAYAERFGRDLQGIVARERYVQTMRVTRGAPSLDGDSLGGEVREQRRLLSSLLLVHEPDTPWQVHRDVMEVDGIPVADRPQRLADLFARPGRPATLGTLADESARYNVGPITRNINVPTFALMVIHPSRRDRFRFRDRGTVLVDGVATRQLAFEERDRPRIIRGTSGYEVVLRGTLWVEESTGEMVRAAIAPKAHRLQPRLVVSFGRVPGVPLRVPVKLLESYWREGDDTYAAGEATYDDFRRYTTDVGAPVVR